jgi:hypothetical protein
MTGPKKEKIYWIYWNMIEYTGRNIFAVITYILDDQEYLRKGFVILALEILVVNN